MSSMCLDGESPLKKIDDPNSEGAPESTRRLQTRHKGHMGPSSTSYPRNWSSTSQQLGRDFRIPLHSLRTRHKTKPLHPAILAGHDDDDLRPHEIRVEVSVDDILRADRPTADPDLEYPQFDCLEAYCILEHDRVSQQAWLNEARRLHEYVKNPELPILFSSSGYLWTGDENGHRALSTLSEKVLTAVSLCILDNESINVRCCPKISSRSRLQKLIEQARVAASPATNPDQQEEDAAARRAEQDALFGLVDYVSAVLARLVAQTGTGKYWQASVICALVKRVAKVKVLLFDLQANAHLAVSGGEEVLDRSQNARLSTTGIIDEEEECEEILRVIAAETKDGLASVQEAQVAAYCVNQSKVRAGVDILLRFFLTSLRLLRRSGLAPMAYEMCGLVYETGFQGFKTLLFQDREMEYSASSDLDNLNTADSAFRILDRTVRHLKGLRNGGDPSNEVTMRRPKTHVEWSYKRTDANNWHGPRGQDKIHLDSLDLEFMDDIVTVMIPLVATNPRLVSELNNFRSTMVLSDDNRELVQPHQESNFMAFFRMYTDTFEGISWPKSTLRLKKAFEAGTFERCRLIDPGDNNISVRTSTFDQRAQVMESEWVMDECSVIAPCSTYVLSIITIAMVFAAGGLSVGFTVGKRIEGVDPFGIAAYGWVLAAFIVLICKSLLVSEWGWRDFLHFRVRCRSVSELEAVTGVRDQMIIAKLLHDESGGGILTTRGPYNSIFTRRSSEGFAIDRPISTTTMLMSGLTPLKVATPRGQALVCLDSRRGTPLRVVEHQADLQQEYLVCEDVSRLRRLANERENSAMATMLQLRLSKGLRWKRVLGIYDARDVVFT